MRPTQRSWLPAPRSPRERAQSVNALLRGLERVLTDPRGLPGRSWYTHLIYAPGVLTGYGAKTLPGRSRGDRAGPVADRREDYARRTAAALNAYSDQLDRASALLRPVG